MRVLIHDFAGHPFQAQLSRQLAKQGHDVTHVFPAGLPGPKGCLTKLSSDPGSLGFVPIRLSQGFRKYSAHRRFIAQRKYAGDLKRVVDEYKPEVVLSGNTPIDVQAEILWFCRRRQIGFVHWVQDVYCEAVRFVLRRQMPVLADVVANALRRIERLVLQQSSATIVIAESFRTLFAHWGVPEAKLTVIQNWAPLDEFPQASRRNSWSLAAGLGDKPVLLYSGTLGMKHRPDLIYRLAEELGQQCTVVVISEGVGEQYLKGQPVLDNLVVLGFQAYDVLPQVLASADVLLATLESDAAEFAVPSKILSYLCAGRPILLAAPAENLASSIVRESGGGVVVDPGHFAAWAEAAKQLVRNANYREDLSKAARSYAERTFDITAVAASFEAILMNVRCNGRRGEQGAVAVTPATSN